MSRSAAAHAAFERVLGRLVTAADPEATLDEALAADDLPAPLRAALARIDRDGLRLSALLVAKLRFERLLRGCPEAEAAFDADPAAFASAFHRYHAEVPPTAFFPPEEAALYRRWRR